MRGKQVGFSREAVELIWRAAIGLTLFALVMTALSIKGQAQQTFPRVPNIEVFDENSVYFERGTSEKPNDTTTITNSAFAQETPSPTPSSPPK
jgi:hypothetical protein